ncbi:MAG TPA: undecaprenyl-diphosphatase UppP [Bacteroidota bacterium]|nr:undecaprenyl-diphosphatase UppP [Bacteroidota bacterium]
MSLLEAILLGIIQGLTEFLPISSTAHLTLAGQLLGLIDPTKPQQWTAFIAIIQLGTAIAVIVYFYHDLFGMTKNVLTDVRTPSTQRTWSYESKLFGKIILGTIPVVVLGLTFKKIIEGTFTKEISTFATALIVLALILLWSEKVGKRNRTEHQTTWKDAFMVGIAQALALIPGSSRSGTTITAGLFLGLTRDAAARFSFLLSIPAVLASGLYELYSMRYQITEVGTAQVVVATIVSGVVGYLSIAFLLKYLRTHTTFIFIYYRTTLGIALWVFYLFGFLA